VAVELGARLGTDLARGDGHGPDPPLAAGVGHVDGVLHKDDRVVVGERHAPAAEPVGGLGDDLGGGLVGQGVGLAGLADVPVLAELAGQVAAGGAEGEDRRAGEEVVERLLLDRIDAEAARPAPGLQDDLVVLTGAHEAEPALSFEQLAEPGTDVALDAPVFQGMPVLGGNGVGERRHTLRYSVEENEAGRRENSPPGSTPGVLSFRW
jgi:hypothetical protein